MTSSARRLPLGRLALLLAGTLLGVGLIVALLRSVSLDQLGSSFAHADYRYLLVGIVPFLFNLLLKVPRWDLLLGDDAPNVDILFGALTVGYAVNTLLPARLGDFVRAYWVRDRAGLPMARTLSTIALERVVDGITVLIMLLAVAPTVSFPRQLLGSALTIGALFVIALVVMIAIAVASRRHPGVARRIDALEQGRWALAGRIVRQLIHGLNALHDARTITLVLLYTLTIWVSNAVLAWLVLRAFHMNVPLSAGFLVVAVLNLGMAVPSSPGYLGIFDYLMVLTLGLYGIHRTPALAASFTYHAIAFVPVTLIGLIYLARAGARMTAQMLRSATPGGVEDTTGITSPPRY